MTTMTSNTTISMQKKQSDKVKNISLFIPRVFNNIDKERIIKSFEKFGEIKDIDMVNVEGKNFKRAFIHYKYWFDTPQAIKFQKSVLDKKENTQLKYDGLWYWIVLENTSVIPQENEETLDETDYKNMEEMEKYFGKNEMNEDYAKMDDLENQYLEEGDTTLVSLDYVTKLEKLNAELIFHNMSLYNQNMFYSFQLQNFMNYQAQNKDYINSHVVEFE
jgi:hypothetical protein